MKTLLLDRDGVLTVERDYDYRPETMELLPGVIEGLKRLSDWQLFVVSNQSGIGRGLTTVENVEACNQWLTDRLKSEGIELRAIAYCPHQPEDKCACRKPAVGMWELLQKKYDLNVEECWMVGNRGSDIEFGQAVGCRTALVVDPHHGDGGTRPDFRIQNLEELADILTAVSSLVTIDDAVRFADEARRKGQKIVTTNGTFDLLHPGHLYLLSEARKQGDVLIVGVNSDASVRRYKGPDRPYESQLVRAAKVSAHADAVFIFDDDDPRAWLKRIRPNVHVNAASYGKDCIEAPVLSEIGAELVLVDVKPELGSTTERLQKMQSQSSS